MKRLLLAAVVIALIALALRKRDSQRREWTGLSEAEAREKLDQKLPHRIPEERRSVMADKIVDRMRERGVIVAEGGDAGGAETGEVDIDLTEQPIETPREAPAAT
ncbi:MAG: hypothetical protein GWN79_04195 [Actinobacteria bacterium]|nr:hypothetical protein [Actinomycetota bacterium]NIS29758.1 hypothetical protein [Actinomycetota bacterium]NIT94696.1 hypothetical protein [Actinomycetota bacterium]NIU18330.1 hypothetical protein [Actinomycetota bacterium]NIU65077.1 hypothetical protein [Actinomycetota bacterium]